MQTLLDVVCLLPGVPLLEYNPWFSPCKGDSFTSLIMFLVGFLYQGKNLAIHFSCLPWSQVSSLLMSMRWSVHSYILRIYQIVGLVISDRLILIFHPSWLASTFLWALYREFQWTTTKKRWTTLGTHSCHELNLSWLTEGTGLTAIRLLVTQLSSNFWACENGGLCIKIAVIHKQL